ncbi:hypothetical protein [Ewingella americana]|uniref:Uncharacterized protein n=1 Tax=Ewingella americana TaxID=41202 RepID=A0A502FV69_9GAMM|nr:hypothetical protein [Ewingella americana]TPG53321.1 hypothetical protein EAH77_24575 [Ewingella americana]
MENLNKQQLILSRIQLIADISQTAQCNSQEFLIVMSLISELASQALPENHDDAAPYDLSEIDSH